MKYKFGTTETEKHVTLDVTSSEVTYEVAYASGPAVVLLLFHIFLPSQKIWGALEYYRKDWENIVCAWEIDIWKETSRNTYVEPGNIIVRPGKNSIGPGKNSIGPGNLLAEAREI